MAGLRFTQPDSETQPDTAAIPKAAYSPDFFEDELRGYRLLKAAKLTSSEKQNILTQTSNSTSFLQVRRALRTLFAEEDESGHSWGRRPRIWWTDDQQSWDTVDDAWQCWDAYDPGHATWYAEEDEESYWAEWTGDDWDEAEWPDLDEAAEDGDQDPAEAQLREAYALAGEANKTLAEARDAVRPSSPSPWLFLARVDDWQGVLRFLQVRFPQGLEEHRSWKGKDRFWTMLHLRHERPQLSGLS